jgi:hypothetical protein
MFRGRIECQRLHNQAHGGLDAREIAKRYHARLLQIAMELQLHNCIVQSLQIFYSPQLVSQNSFDSGRLRCFHSIDSNWARMLLS